MNTLRREPNGRLTGDMTDGLAMRAALEAAGHPPAGKSALLVGAGGGAGAAIADALCEAGVPELHVAETDDGRRGRIVTTLQAAFRDVLIVEDDGKAAVDLGINASPLGMSPDHPLPFDVTRLAKGGVVADVVTPEAPSPLMQEAAAQGYTTVTGAMMAEHQLQFQLAHWGLTTKRAFGSPEDRSG